MARKSLIALALLTVSGPALANQWVLGNVKAVSDNSGYSINYEIIFDLANITWGSGTTSNGPAACVAFKVVVGVQGITEEAKARYWSALLTQKALGQPIVVYVDTADPYCAVQVLGFGYSTVP